jgi:hypothetical protein
MTFADLNAVRRHRLISSISRETAVELDLVSQTFDPVGFPTAARFTLRVRAYVFPIACRNRAGCGTGGQLPLLESELWQESSHATISGTTLTTTIEGRNAAAIRLE